MQMASIMASRVATRLLCANSDNLRITYMEKSNISSIYYNNDKIKPAVCSAGLLYHKMKGES